MSPYILMCIAIAFTTLNGVFLHKFSNKGLKNTGDIFLYNSLISLVWSVVLLILAIATDGIKINASTLLFSLSYALVLCAYQLFKCLSLSTGPISLTTLIANCAFLITTAYAFFVEDEAISILQLVGIIILLCALFLCIGVKFGKGTNAISITCKWLIFVLALFSAGGGIGIIYRVFGKSDVSQNATSMLLFASIISSVVFLALAYISNGITKKPKPNITKNAFKYALICGVTGCIYIRMNVSLSAVIDPVIFFPVSNGATVILSSVIGWCYFKERLKINQIVGIVLGIIAIVLIGCF